MSTEHSLDASRVHHDWDNSPEPVLAIQPGDVVEFELLMAGAQTAVRNMIGWLVDEHGLSREDAYILCSLAGDLRIYEIVDAGVWNVGMTMPLAVFG
jgi:acetamidase/formamidase